MEPGPGGCVVGGPLFLGELGGHVGHQGFTGLAKIGGCGVFDLSQRQTVMGKLVEVIFQLTQSGIELVRGCGLLPTGFVRQADVELVAGVGTLGGHLSPLVLHDWIVVVAGQFLVGGDVEVEQLLAGQVVIRHEHRRTGTHSRGLLLILTPHFVMHRVVVGQREAGELIEHRVIGIPLRQLAAGVEGVAGRLEEPGRVVQLFGHLLQGSVWRKSLVVNQRDSHFDAVQQLLFVGFTETLHCVPAPLGGIRLRQSLPWRTLALCPIR